MIGYLKGNIKSLKPTRLILDVNGVGYLVNISISTYERISDKAECELFIYTSVKEDSISLFGFYTEVEKEMFELLISVNGIGPKSALTVLSGITIDRLKEAITFADYSTIVTIPGIGKKTAERMVLELRSKVDAVGEGVSIGGVYDNKKEAIAALATLGYNNKIAEKVIKDIYMTEPEIDLQKAIVKALSVLNK